VSEADDAGEMLEARTNLLFGPQTVTSGAQVSHPRLRRKFNLAFPTERPALLPPADSVLSRGFCILARSAWHKRKHGYVRRTVRRLQNSRYALLGSSIVSNTSGRALSSGSALKSSVSLPT
jgi:hypothetical protein